MTGSAWRRKGTSEGFLASEFCTELIRVVGRGRGARGAGKEQARVWASELCMIGVVGRGRGARDAGEEQPEVFLASELCIELGVR